MSGVHCQMSTTIADQRARVGFGEPVDRDGLPEDEAEEPAFSGPSTWKIMKKMKPETAGTTIIGSRKNTVSRPRPRKFFRKSSARAKPRPNSTATATTVNEHGAPDRAPRTTLGERLPVAVEPVPELVRVPDIRRRSSASTR